MKKDILICGVGGQGTVLASKIIAASAMDEGSAVHSAETIGMAQRGGSVTSHVRIGEAYAPLIPQGAADMILAFEPAEAVRNLGYLKKDGIVIVNRVPVKPVTESLQARIFGTGPSQTRFPPLSPPPGPRSMIQSALRMTSRLCSMTTTVFP